MMSIICVPTAYSDGIFFSKYVFIGKGRDDNVGVI